MMIPVQLISDQVNKVLNRWAKYSPVFYGLGLSSLRQAQGTLIRSLSLSKGTSKPNPKVQC